MQYPNIPTSTPVLATKTDSVISHMQYKIDSLSKVVEKTEIAHGFFSDVISQDLYMFSTIVVIAGLILWGSIFTIVAVHKRKIERNTSKTLNDANKVLTEQFEKLRYDTNFTSYNLQRALYIIMRNDGSDINAFDYALDALLDFSKIADGSDNDNEMFKNWLNVMAMHLDNIQSGNEAIVEKREDMADSIDKIKLIIPKGYIEDFNNLRTKFYTVAYSEGNPPENLADGFAESPPIQTNERPSI